MLAKLIRTALSAVFVLSMANALAGDWPTRPVRWIVPYPPGGGTDVLARVLGDVMS